MANEYLKVANGDIELMGNVIHQMRGRRTVGDYSMDCGFGGRTLSTVTGNERKSDYISGSMMFAIYENRDPESDITEDNVLAANGCIKVEYLDSMRRKMMKEGILVDPETCPDISSASLSDFGNGCFSLYNPSMEKPASRIKEEQRGRKTKADLSVSTQEILDNMEQSLTGKERKADKYVAFLLDLAKFSLALDAKEYNALRHHVHSLSEDVFFCTVLHEYCELVEYDDEHDMEELKKFFKGERADVPEWAEESKDYFDVLYDLLFNRNYFGEVE